MALSAISGFGTGVEVVYMIAALLFILGLKRLSIVKTARSGNLLASLGMLLAIGATMVLLWGHVALWIILLGVLVGGGAGGWLAKKVPMTAMPELVAFFNGMGGGASMFVALSEVLHGAQGEGSLSAQAGPDFAIALALSVLIGAVTMSGSLVAYGKLSGKFDKSRIGILGLKACNIGLMILCAVLCWYAGFGAEGSGGVVFAYLALTVFALILGIGFVMPIGGADMPVVISLLNSYSGIAASATGFALQNNLLIIAGSLVGASGLILTRIMCKAMNRSLVNVLFSGFGEQGAKDDSGYTGVKSTTADELAPILDAAQSVIFVPGYGLAVAQAQHKVRELADMLEARGCQVRYAIHPVAGRMPGHMNVLLAEADVPYEQLFELERINGDFKNTDVAVVIGANDVCNPAASDPQSAIAGMPVLHVWEAQTVVVVKRSLSAGYAGIKNELFQMDNSLMLFADAKKAVEDTIAELKEL